MGSLDDVKTNKHTFSTQKLHTRVTVADKLVLVIHFDEITICSLFNAMFIRCFKLICTACVIDLNIDLSDVTNRYYTLLHRTVVVYEKKNR